MGSLQLKADSILTGHLSAESITTEKLAALAVTAEKIAAGSVSADKLDMLFDALLSSQSVNKQLLDRFAEKIEAKKQSLG